MSAKKQVAKILKRERTLIENVVELSKKVILTKYFKARLIQDKSIGSRLGCILPSLDQLSVLITEATNRIQELTSAIVTQLKTAYTKDKVIIPDGFYLTYLQLADGYCILERSLGRKRVKFIKNGKEKTKVIHRLDKVVLFLSDNEDGFLETIKAGEVKSYSEVKDRLHNCKSQIKGDKIVDILLGKYAIDSPFVPSDETIQRYKNTED